MERVVRVGLDQVRLQLYEEAVGCFESRSFFEGTQYVSLGALGIAALCELGELEVKRRSIRWIEGE